MYVLKMGEEDVYIYLFIYLFIYFYYSFFLLLFICAYNAWVISPRTFTFRWDIFAQIEKKIDKVVESPGKNTWWLVDRGDTSFDLEILNVLLF
jgi:hypothetical protein